MIGNIRAAFIDILEKSTWMDEVSKRKAIDKARSIDEKIGYPDYLGSDNTTELENDYAEYQFNSSYIHNVLKIVKIKSRESLRMLREPIDRHAWGSTPPTVVNAFYTPPKNQITFPAGILQTPFFDKDAPKYLNYGGIGAVIGHEITHGFDDNGRQYDKDGNRILWWTQKTIDRFNERKKCIVDQYGSYVHRQINMTVNGNQTQGESIADNGGIKQAFYAYRKWIERRGKKEPKLPGLAKYSPEQLFFINYAHVWCSKITDSSAISRIVTGYHPPAELRVLGPTSNFDEFERAFKCRPGQGNSRSNKCSVW